MKKTFAVVVGAICAVGCSSGGGNTTVQQDCQNILDATCTAMVAEWNCTGGDAGVGFPDKATCETAIGTLADGGPACFSGMKGSDACPDQVQRDDLSQNADGSWSYPDGGIYCTPDANGNCNPSPFLSKTYNSANAEACATALKSSTFACQPDGGATQFQTASTGGPCIDICQ